MKKIIILLILFIYLFLPGMTYADDINLKEPVIKPGGPFYLLKRGYEKILEKLQFSDESKLKYHQNLSLIRLAELKYIAENKKIGQLQVSSQRLSYEVGKTAEISTNLNKTDQKEIFNKLNQYKPVLEKLRDLYPDRSSFWRLIQYDIETLEILSGKFSQ